MVAEHPRAEHGTGARRARSFLWRNSTRLKGLAPRRILLHTGSYEREVDDDLLEVKEVLAWPSGGASGHHDAGPLAQGTGGKHARGESQTMVLAERAGKL